MKAWLSSRFPCFEVLLIVFLNIAPSGPENAFLFLLAYQGRNNLWSDRLDTSNN